MALVTVTGATQAMSVNTRYVTNSVGAVQLTLPANPRVGEAVAITDVGTGNWVLDLARGQILVDPATRIIGTLPNWTPTGSGNAGWNPLATDVAGNTVFAGVGDTIRLSSDGGETWDNNVLTVLGSGWRGIAVSADVSKVVVVGNANTVRTSSDIGQTWSTPAGLPRRDRRRCMWPIRQWSN